jgi:hypothetical protein
MTPNRNSGQDEPQGQMSPSEPPHPNPTEREIRTAAFECPDRAAAAQRIGVKDIDVVLSRSEKLNAAWERGRLLRQVRDVAANSPLIPEAADRELQWPKGTLVKLLTKDRIVREIWREARHEALMKVQRSIFARAQDGDPNAVKAYERLMEHREPSAAADFRRLTQTQLTEATGYPRQTLLRWEEANGLPRNADRTYSMPNFLAWLLKWERDKLTGGSESAGLNPLQAEKARRERRENDEAEGRLVPLAIHVEELKRRAHCLAGLLNAFRAKDWAQAFAGKTEAEREQEILAAFAAVRDAYKSMSPDIPLPDEPRAKIEEALAMLTRRDAEPDNSNQTTKGS